jgi:acetyltransferase-like isoleucine patch superfamily enzyme
MKPDTLYTGSVARPIAYWSNKRLVRNKLLAVMAHSWPMPSSIRTLLHQWRGVRFTERRKVFIGEDVVIDVAFPENIVIGRNVMITSGAMILSHHYETGYRGHVFRVGRVVIEDDVFIGARALIVSNLTVGAGATIAAGAVVTTDIPPGAVVGGVPARIIGRRGDTPLPPGMPTLNDVMRQRPGSS